MGKFSETVLVLAALVVMFAGGIYISNHVSCFDLSPLTFKGCVVK